MKHLKFASLFVLTWIFSLGQLQAQLMIPVFSEPETIEALNSDAEESMPLSFNEGDGFYFYRTYVEGEGSNTKIKGQDIWVCEKKKSEWERPYRLFRAGYLKGSGSVAGTSKDGNRIYLFITSYSETGTERKLGYMDKKGKDKWSSLTEIEIEGLEYEERYYSFYMSKDEEILMVSMSPSESHLDEDLYVSLKKGENKYGQLIDLGKQINTPKYEVSPYIADDGKTLYFSSNGHGGMGESDIFISKRLDDSWTEWTIPLNLGAPINSDGVEAYFTIGNNNDVFFTTDRGMQQSGIFKSTFTGEYRFAYTDSSEAQFVYEGLPVENVTLEIYDLEDNLIDVAITDEEGKFVYRKLRRDDVYIVKIKEEDPTTYLGSFIYLNDKEGNRNKRLIRNKEGNFIFAKEIVGEREKIQGRYNYNNLPQDSVALVLFDENGFAVDTIYTDEDGYFEYEKLSYDKQFTIQPLDAVDETSAIDLYLTNADGKKTKQLTAVNGKFSFVDIDQVKAEPIATQSAKNKGNLEKKEAVFFEFAKNNLTKAEKERADQTISFLNSNPKLKIELIGHTDAIGTLEDNQARGLSRAEAVKSYMLSNGIDASRIIKVSSKGETAPIASNDSAEGRAKNRRVEVKVVK
mgnify:CR=1 FL=1